VPQQFTPNLATYADRSLLEASIRTGPATAAADTRAKNSEMVVSWMQTPARTMALRGSFRIFEDDLSKTCPVVPGHQHH
jgi:hypothetical protein